MATDTAKMMSLAELVSDSDKDWATELYKKAMLKTVLIMVKSRYREKMEEETPCIGTLMVMTMVLKN